MGLWLAVASGSTLLAAPGDDSYPPKPQAYVGTTSVAYADGRVTVPIRIRHAWVAHGVQITLALEPEVLELDRLRTASDAWAAEEPLTYPGGLVIINLRRVGAVAETGEEEGTEAAFVTFSIRDLAGKFTGIRLDTALAVVDRIGPQGSYFYVLGGSGSQYPIPGDLHGGSVTIYRESGLELGSVGITARGQSFSLPLYLTYLEAAPVDEPLELTIGIDYDELFLRYDRAVGVPPLVPAGELESCDGVECQRYGDLEVTLPLAMNFPTPVFSQPVAELRFTYIRPVPARGNDSAETDVKVVLVPGERHALGAGAGAGEAEDPPTEGAQGEETGPPRVTGSVTLLPAYFVRGNVDSRYVLSREFGTIVRHQAELTDVIRILEAKFFAGRPLGCERAADLDDSCIVDITDAVMLLNHLFRGGPPPVAPYPQPGFDNDSTCGLGCDVRIPFFQLLGVPGGRD